MQQDSRRAVPAVGSLSESWDLDVTSILHDGHLQRQSTLCLSPIQGHRDYRHQSTMRQDLG